MLSPKIFSWTEGVCRSSLVLVSRALLAKLTFARQWLAHQHIWLQRCLIQRCRTISQLTCSRLDWSSPISCIKATVAIGLCSNIQRQCARRTENDGRQITRHPLYPSAYPTASSL